MPSEFSRDLGYLAKFLGGLRTHASTLGPAGTRLEALLDEQDRAWAEIQALLAGSQVIADPTIGKTALAGAPMPTTAAKGASTRRLTVGSLLS